MDYSLNVTEFPARKIQNVWKPDSIYKLKEILKNANEKGQPVYPISTGHNWGLGSKLPVLDADIIDLSELNEIIEVNEFLSYARIQPGVTQIQLSEYLAENHPELILNVTGSDAYSSVLGNAIERGSGKNGQRVNDVRELKVMSALGDELSTGFGSYRGQNTSFYQYGLGPDFTHVFTQSNLSIVTEGVINLIPRQPFSLYLTTVGKDDLGDFLREFSLLNRKGVLGNSLEIDSQNDPKIYELFQNGNYLKDGWICWFVTYGEAEIRTAKNKAVLSTLNSIGAQSKVYESTQDHSSSPLPVQVRISRYNGIPNDHSLLATARAFGIDIDEKNPDLDIYKDLPGFRCVLPVIPFSSEGARIIDLIFDYSKSTAFNPAISIISLDAYALEVFARVYFTRTNEIEIKLASDWASGLLEVLKEEGIFPYRLDVENMIPYLSNVKDPFSELKQVIKNHLDPKGIIAPGRYHLIN